MAIKAAAVTVSSPIIRTGAIMLPADSTAAVEEPVIIPGNMITAMMRISRIAGCLWNFLMITALNASRVPDFSTTFINTMAVAITRIVSM